MYIEIISRNCLKQLTNGKCKAKNRVSLFPGGHTDEFSRRVNADGLSLTLPTSKLDRRQTRPDQTSINQSNSHRLMNCKRFQFLVRALTLYMTRLQVRHLSWRPISRSTDEADCSIVLVEKCQSVAPVRILKWGARWKNFSLRLHFLALQVQLVVSMIAFMMDRTVCSAVPHAVGATGRCQSVSNVSGRSYPRSSTRGDLAVPRTKTSTQRTMQVCSVGANKLELTTTVVP